jgi:hypothetical protein
MKSTLCQRDNHLSRMIDSQSPSKSLSGRSRLNRMPAASTPFALEPPGVVLCTTCSSSLSNPRQTRRPQTSTPDHSATTGSDAVFAATPQILLWSQKFDSFRHSFGGLECGSALSPLIGFPATFNSSFGMGRPYKCYCRPDLGFRHPIQVGHHFFSLSNLVR